MINDHTDHSGHDCPNHFLHSHTDCSGFDSVTYPPPSSNAPTDISSAVTSDSELLHLPQPRSSKLKQQSGLLNFFSVAPAENSYSIWRKRKRDNQERDGKEHAETTCQEKEWKEEEAEKLCKQKCLNQQAHREKVKAKEVKAGLRDKDGKKKLPVSHILVLPWRHPNLLV